MQRLGLCCLFKEAPIRFRTTTVRYLSSLPEKGRDPFAYLAEIIEHNLKNLFEAVLYCSEQQIRAFRISSTLLPVYTHPEWGYSLADLPNESTIRTLFKAVREEAASRDIRLSFHPDQFVVLSAFREEVIIKSIADLEYHAVMAELVGADAINIHGGGGYGDKEAALERFRDHFTHLSPAVQKRLTLENDDKIFTPQELLPLCKDLKIPFVYDVHHHRCLPDNLSIADATELALKTWDREPLFHLSSPKEGWSGKQPRLHHDFIDAADMPEEWKELDPLTIDVEAKAKELAVSKLQKELRQKGWGV